jgi:hypothetical protein
MNGYIIQHATCPACHIQRTVRRGFSATSICMNCGQQWDATTARIGAPGPRQMPPETVLEGFVPAEISRLEVYRRAVVAGFYSDWS